MTMTYKNLDAKRAYERGKTRRKRARNPIPTLESNKRWRLRNAERVKLIIQVGRSVRAEIAAGRIVRPAECSRCAQPGRIEAAHSDYSRPFDIVWLCLLCHRKWDHVQPKTVLL